MSCSELIIAIIRTHYIKKETFLMKATVCHMLHSCVTNT